ncbi:hypothetical protein EBV26_05120 [bacterium]|nr:hypothetical protein [bacterium]
MLTFKELMERINVAKTKMGDVIKDFQDSDAPQFKGKSKEKRRQMAIAAKLEADRGVKEEVEQIDELSSDTLKSYRGKAKEQGVGIQNKMKMGGGDWSKDGKDTKTLQKRHSGYTTAGKKLVKRGDAILIKKEEVEQTDEELKGSQHKIDANKNGKVDSNDFKILRNAKKARYQ